MTRGGCSEKAQPPDSVQARHACRCCAWPVSSVPCAAYHARGGRWSQPTLPHAIRKCIPFGLRQAHVPGCLGGSSLAAAGMTSRHLHELASSGTIEAGARPWSRLTARRPRPLHSPHAPAKRLAISGAARDGNRSECVTRSLRSVLGHHHHCDLPGGGTLGRLSRGSLRTAGNMDLVFSTEKRPAALMVDIGRMFRVCINSLFSAIGVVWRAGVED